MSLLALDACGSEAGLALLDESGTLQGRWSAPLKPGLIETLPLLLQQALNGQNITDIAVCTGPGSFTGLRTSIALAQGVAAGLDVTLWGISAWEAYMQALPDLPCPLWVVVRARRGRLFLLRDGHAAAFDDEALPTPTGIVALAGDATEFVAAGLAARGVEVISTSVRLPDSACVGRAALLCKHQGRQPEPALPLYIDPPEAKRPAAGLRPTPL